MATDTATATMTTERMLDFFNAWNQHDVDRITTFFTTDGAYDASIGAEDDGSAFSACSGDHGSTSELSHVSEPPANA